MNNGKNALFNRRRDTKNRDAINKMVNLKPTIDQLILIMSKAVAEKVLPPPTQKVGGLNTINFPALHHDLYQQAMQGPYGLLIRQVFDGLFVLVIIQQSIKSLIEKILRLKAELHERELDEKVVETSDGVGPRAVTTSEMLENEIALLEDHLKHLNDDFPRTQNRMLETNQAYLSKITFFLAKTACTAILNRATALGYSFSKGEKEMLLNPVSRATITEKLQSSYQEAQNSGIDKIMPSTEDLTSRSLHDLELRTLMVLNAYRNRLLEEESNPKKEHSIKDENGNPPQSAQQAAKIVQSEKTIPRLLREEFDEMYNEQAKNDQQHKRSDATMNDLKNNPRARFAEQNNNKSVPKNSVMASLKLLKEFSGTFESLDEKINELHKMHKDNHSNEEIFQKMASRVQSWKAQSKNTAPEQEALENHFRTPTGK